MLCYSNTSPIFTSVCAATAKHGARDLCSRICCCSSRSKNSSRALPALTSSFPMSPSNNNSTEYSQQSSNQQRKRHGAKSQQPQPTAAAAELDAPGMPLLLGLKQLPDGAQSLLGWQVLLCGSNEAVGTVVQVQQLPSYPLLRVSKQSTLQPYGFLGREAHSIQLVPAIADVLYPRQHMLLITPPPGLLDLGRRELLLSFLSKELLQYAPLLPHPACVAGQPLTDVRCMPTRQQLLSAGRQDLVGLINKVGGFTEAALLLGLRAARRPAGYWDSLEVMDAELDAFVAGCWTALPLDDEDVQQDNQAGGPLSGGDAAQTQQQQQQQQQQQPAYYYYNMATRSILWELPAAARPLMPAAAHTAQHSLAHGAAAAAGQPGDVGRTEHSAESNMYGDIDDLEDDRDVDYEDECEDDGDDDEEDREDTVGDKERPVSSLQQGLGSGAAAAAAGLNSRAVRRALLALAGERVMPSQSCIKSAGRWDLHTAITRAGGYKEVGRLLQRRPSWPVPKDDAAVLTVQELQDALTEAAACEGLWGPEQMPTVRQLQLAGRQDLVPSVMYHGGRHAVAQQLGLLCKRPAPGMAAGSTAERLAQQLLQFMIEHPPDEVPKTSSSSSSSRGMSDGNTSSAAASSSDTGSYAMVHSSSGRITSQATSGSGSSFGTSYTKPGGSSSSSIGRSRLAKVRLKRHSWQQLPTQRQLRAAARPDLVAGLQKYGHDRIRLLLGLPEPDRKQLRKGVLHWEAVESAVKSGCHSVTGILAYISKLQQQQGVGQLGALNEQHIQQQQQQQQRDLVRREHLARSLKAWCDHGLLVKPRRGWYDLPG